MLGISMMLRLLTAFVCIVSCVTFAIALDDQSAGAFHGFKVIRLKVKTEEALKALSDLNEDGMWDFWMEPALNASSDILVSPQQLPKIRHVINEFDIEHEVIMDELDKAVEAEAKTSVNRNGNEMNWNSYQRLETIYSWMESMEQSYNHSSSYVKVQLTDIGQSFEGRPMKVMKISSNWTPDKGRVTKNAVWMDGGIHAREWISPATVTYIANEVLQASLRAEAWACTFDWYFAPSINPDGYEYSHASLANRFWRKTRSFRRGSGFLDALSNICVGADANRNWDYHWGGRGASNNPCASNYRGREASSEVEVRNVQRFILSREGAIKLYLSMHSYSQLILLPWGHSYDYSDDYNELFRVASRAATRLEKVQGTTYRAGATPHILYPASGGSHDWAKGVAGIKYSYTVELPDRGFYGFLLPSSWIIPTGDETVELVRSMAEDIRSIYYYHHKDSIDVETHDENDISTQQVQTSNLTVSVS